MATQKPISTISYNSEAFLKDKLDTWYQAHIIQAYMFICHKGEDGDKNHIHLRIEPNKKLDPMDLQNELLEYQLGSDKPLGVRPFRPSKEEDWILYAVHDADYLKLKYRGGEKGEKIPYKWQDIRVSEYYDMEVAFIRAKASLEHSSVNMATRLQNGENALTLILEGENPYMVNSVFRTVAGTDYERVASELSSCRNELSALYDAIDSYGLMVSVDADGHPVLTPKTDAETGEILF